jgi:hypothetical protein
MLSHGGGVLRNVAPTGSRYDAVLTNDATWGVGKFGRCLSVDGTDDYAAAPHVSELDGLAEITVMAWVLTNNPTSSTDTVISVHGPGLDQLWLNRDVGENLEFRVDAGGGAATAQMTDGIPNNSDGIWFHVAGTYDGAIIKAYVDGVLGDTTAAITGTLDTVTNPFWIGGDIDGDWNGLIDDVRVYGTALSQAQILDIMNNPYKEWGRMLSIYVPAAPVGVAPTGVFYGPLYGPLGGPIG